MKCNFTFIPESDADMETLYQFACSLEGETAAVPATPETAPTVSPATTPAPAAAEQPAPPPPATPPAPVAPADTEAVTYTSVDKRGYAWDERIHMEPPKFLKGGNWRNKKKLDPAFVAEVEAELAAGITGTTNAEPAPATPPAAEQPAPPPPAPPPAPEPVAEEQAGYIRLAHRLQEVVDVPPSDIGIAHFKLTSDNPAFELLAMYGVDGLTDLHQHADKFDAIEKAVDYVWPKS